MLESGRIGGVSGDGDIAVFMFHDGDTFSGIISAEAADVGTVAIGESDLVLDDELISDTVKFGSDISETVDSGDDIARILA